MAKLNGFLPLEGTLGGLTFYKTEDGTIVKNKGGVSSERMHTDQAFERTREHWADFRTSAKASKFMYGKCRDIVLCRADRKIFSRLNTVMLATLKADQTNVQGTKKIMDGDLTLLRDFEFNRHAQLISNFFGDIDCTIERLTGQVKAVIPSFEPKELLMVPDADTVKYFRFVLGGLELDFVNQEYVREKAYSAWIPWTKTATTPITLTSALTPNSLLPIFELIGIEYAKEDAGVKLPFKNGSFNSVTITKLDIPS